MAKVKKAPTPRDAYPKLPAKEVSAPPVQTHAIRETVESIVIAFVLAFLFRTFEAEAFVIPTGSMAPTLMGAHKDVTCPQCGYRYQVNASEEESDNPRVRRSDVISGMCPVCHYSLPMRPDLPGPLPEGYDPKSISTQSTYNGDRILVNKYIYSFTDPERWDIVVFHFPGNAQMNYIKRLVGLPGEILRVFQGNLFTAPKGSKDDAAFQIERKPPEKVLAMRQLVHDTNYEPADLIDAGWPLRWQPVAGSGANWQVEKQDRSKDVRPTYQIDQTGAGDAWLRYRHVVPNFQAWQQLAQLRSKAPANSAVKFADADIAKIRPRLITDANPYDAREDRYRWMERHNHQADLNTLEIDLLRQGVHWVGDLMVEADVDVEAARGALLLDLVQGGQHFGCSIDLTNGEATLSADGLTDYAPKAKTTLVGPGKYHVGFANVDERLLLWVNGKLVDFPSSTAFNVDAIFGNRNDIQPRTSADDPGDLAPAGIGARDAKLSINRLQVWRDIYYIAQSWRDSQGYPISDFDQPPQVLAELPGNPALWKLYTQRRHVDFPLGDDQFFVMGDNSAESSDARLWRGQGANEHPGGDYLERRLLIGKALCVYWPHSWNRIPGTPIPFPLFPNVMDMRLVR